MFVSRVEECPGVVGRNEERSLVSGFWERWREVGIGDLHCLLEGWRWSFIRSLDFWLGILLKDVHCWGFGLPAREGGLGPDFIEMGVGRDPGCGGLGVWELC